MRPATQWQFCLKATLASSSQNICHARIRAPTQEGLPRYGINQKKSLCPVRIRELLDDDGVSSCKQSIYYFVDIIRTLTGLQCSRVARNGCHTSSSLINTPPRGRALLFMFLLRTACRSPPRILRQPLSCTTTAELSCIAHPCLQG